ncbi:uncharacterized protein LOC130649207 [Hydractinia symbiolongicarpus]|uniref:uncharacterized protein LOC130649207 n=1 Tax=Hydractinia symbiolongicarpus TaxID=13093 RepID=UPI00254F2D2B|nr:uncharacterized protein LOC130649207 [Hydractinia symbiolongicarpus]
MLKLHHIFLVLKRLKKHQLQVYGGLWKTKSQVFFFVTLSFSERQIMNLMSYQPSKNKIMLLYRSSTIKMEMFAAIMKSKGSIVDNILDTMFAQIHNIENPALPQGGFTIDGILRTDVDCDGRGITRGSHT